MEIEYINNVEEILSALEQAKAKALETCGLLAEGYAKKLCPVDTGNLRNSITHATDVEERCTYIGTDVEYAPYVEYGTYKHKAQPFIKPAVADHGDTYQSIIENTLRKS